MESSVKIQVQKITDTFFRLSELKDWKGDGNLVPSVDAYLLIGNKKAVLIDTLQSARGLYREVRRLTSLPLDVLITHGHVDHAGVALPEFLQAGCKVYMSFKDFELLHFMGSPAEKEWFCDLKEGDVWELGGYRLQAFGCAGHSAGSVVLFDAGNGLLFTGDAVGAGNFWMHIPGACPLGVLKSSLENLMARIGQAERLVLYTGHQVQAPGILTEAYIREVYALTEDIMEGSVVGEACSAELLGQRVDYRVANRGMVYSYCYRENV